MVNHDVISMPDKWEYPWYVAWDLAFHTIPLSMVDPDFAKGQLDLMLSQAYLHPTGQIPAYEWAFSDATFSVHAFATLLMHSLEVDLAAAGTDPDGVDRDFLTDSFHKLLLNFTWWVNRKDLCGRNLFDGGFLGLDNVGVFDRAPPFRPAVTSSRPTARRGWRCTALDMLTWPSCWPFTIRSTRTTPLDSTPTSFTSRRP